MMNRVLSLFIGNASNRSLFDVLRREQAYSPENQEVVLIGTKILHVYKVQKKQTMFPPN